MLRHIDVLRRTATSYCTRPALIGPDGRQLTYGQLDEITSRVAGALRQRGLRAGDVMAWLDQNSLDYVIAYFATAKLGMSICPLNYWLRAGELAPQLDLVEPAVVAAGPDFIGLVTGALGDHHRPQLLVTLGEATEGFDAWMELESGEPFVDDNVTEEARHEIIFTSGTTGQAKGVARSQRQRILDSMNAALAYELTRDDHMLWFLPQFHIGGVSVPNQLLIQGGTVTILRRFEPVDVAAALTTGVTYVVGVPAHYNLLFESGALADVDTSQVRGCFLGGSVASPRVFDDIQAAFPNADLVHGYGSTESGPHTMALRGAAFLERRGSLGLPVPGSEVRVVDPDTGQVVGHEQVGELQVRSDSVMTEYVGRPELTAAAFTPGGWLKTGDLVRTDADGYFYVVDRVKDIIITGGENVYPKEVEDVLSSHPSVAEVAVIGVPDEIYEERVVAIVRTAPGVEPVEPQVLIDHVRQRLAGYKTPKQVIFVDDFPRTGVGKIAKHELRTQHGSVFT